MTRTSRLAALTLAACLLALPAAADMTAPGLWQSWQELASHRGGTLTAKEDPHSTVLFLTDLTATFASGDDSVTAILAAAELRPLPDGTVQVLVQIGSKLTITATPPDAEPTTATFTINRGLGARAPQLMLIASGDAAAPDYALTAPSVGLELMDLRQGATTIPAKFLLAFTDLFGSLSGFSPTGAAPFSGDLAASAITCNLNFTDPVSGDMIGTSYNQSDVKITADITPAISASALAANLHILGGASATISSQNSKDRGQVLSMTQQESSDTALTIAQGRADLVQTSTGLEMMIAGPGLPASGLHLTMPTARINLSLPIAPAPEAQRADLTLALDSVQGADDMWAALDPSGKLPRVPGSLALDLSADLKGVSPEATPLQPEGFQVNALRLDFAGAQLTANGKFTLSELSGQILPGVSTPVGRLDIMVKGATTLLEQLMSAGLIGSQQAMMAQMMMGVFASPGDGDTLTSRIVTQPDGGLLVNGNRLK